MHLDSTTMYLKSVLISQTYHYPTLPFDYPTSVIPKASDHPTLVISKAGTVLGERAFSVGRPRFLNSLPVQFCLVANSFCSQLKNYLIKIAYPPSAVSLSLWTDIPMLT